MQFKHGKVVFGYKDTFSMESTLAPIICAGLKKFKEIANAEPDRKWLPSSVTEELIAQGVIAYQEDYCLSEIDWDKAMAHYEYLIDEMIYAFDESNEPNISDYDFHYNMDTEEADSKTGYIPATITCTNKEESDRYTKAMQEYYDRCDKGREVFSRHFKSLWW